MVERVRKLTSDNEALNESYVSLFAVLFDFMKF